MNTMIYLLTPIEMAASLKRSQKTLARWRRLRVGPPFLRLNGRVLYDPAEVVAWLPKSGGDRA